MSKNNAVEVRDVKKTFFLPHHSTKSIKQTFTQMFKTKKRGGEYFNALNGVSFDVQKGDFFGILGRNGSGKSTLLKIISNIYQPSEGSVTHNGKLVSFIELGVGFKPELTGRENVYLNGGLLGFSRREVEEIYDSIVEFAELEDFMDQKLKNYSSGMKVRLAFSVAIRAKADILILDEVLAVGDAAFQQKCNDYFQTLKDDHKTVILVTHSMNAVRDFCNRGVVIDGGKIIFDGDADEAADKYLSMFETNKPKDEKNKNKQTLEKIDKKVKIESISLDSSTNQLTASVELRSKTRRDDIKLAIRILDVRGKVVAGVNTQSVLNPLIINLKAGETRRIIFTMPNILGDGKFTVDARVGPVVVTGTIHDKAQSAAYISNSNPEAFYPVLLPASVEVKEN